MWRDTVAKCWGYECGAVATPLCLLALNVLAREQGCRNVDLWKSITDFLPSGAPSLRPHAPSSCVA
jgi:hypothetical protein